jgi:hypothetical protein
MYAALVSPRVEFGKILNTANVFIRIMVFNQIIAQQGGINEKIMTILKDEHTSFIKAIFWHISSQSSENKLNN